MAANIKNTKAYKSLIALGTSPDEAVALLSAKAKTTEQVEKRGLDYDALAKELGLTRKQVVAALTGQAAPAEPEDKRTVSERLVEENGYSFTKGRVYLTTEMLAVVSRVLQTGTPEIAQTSGKGRIAAVLVVREESGDASVQNLTKNA